MIALAARLLWTLGVAASVGYSGARVGRVLPIYIGGGAALASAPGLRPFESAVSAFGLQAPQVVEVAAGTAPFDDRGAAERARQAGAAFALVATPTEIPAQGEAAPVSLLKLSLVRSDDGSRTDVALVRVADGEGIRHAVSGMLGEAAPAALSLSPEAPPASIERPKAGWQQITVATAVVAISSVFVYALTRTTRALAADGVLPAVGAHGLGR